VMLIISVFCPLPLKKSKCDFWTWGVTMKLLRELFQPYIFNFSF
jgi:hypothetical protein